MLTLDAEQIWFQLCLAPGALVTLDHTELRYRMVYRPLNKAPSDRRGGKGEEENGRRVFEAQGVHDGSVFLSRSAWGKVEAKKPVSARHARRPLTPDGEMLPSRQAYLSFMYPTPVKRL